MKTLIISIALVVGASMVCPAQEITVLDEAKLVFAPSRAEVIQSGDQFIYKVNGNLSKEFAKNPIAFMKANFDIQKFIKQVGNDKYDGYLVSFESPNGSLRAEYNHNGKLLKTLQNFKNVILPKQISKELYLNYNGWVIVKNRYVAKTRGEIVHKEVYTVVLENGNDRQRVKVDGKNIGSVVASN